MAVSDLAGMVHTTGVSNTLVALSDGTNSWWIT